ncbi:MAG: hypothetical protein V5A88_04515 [Candidatus Thermoplasmatota archaeon]
MKRKYLYELAGGALLIVLAMALRTFLPDLDSRITGMIGTAGLGLAVVSLLLSYQYGEDEVEEDERTRKINLKAQSYSWILTFFPLLAIGLIFNFEHLSGPMVYLTILFVMTGPAVFFRLYLERKPVNI